jgi:hypothetical protein
VKAAQQASELPGLQELFSKEGLAQLMKQSAATFPQEPVEKGDQWSDQVEVSNETVGTRIITTNYVYEGEEQVGDKNLDKLSMSITIEFAPDENGQTPVTISEQKADGSVFFDAESGQVVNGTIDQHMKMEVSVQGVKIPQDITTKTDVKVTTDAP